MSPACFGSMILNSFGRRLINFALHGTLMSCLCHNSVIIRNIFMKLYKNVHLSVDMYHVFIDLKIL